MEMIFGRPTMFLYPAHIRWCLVCRWMIKGFPGGSSRSNKKTGSRKIKLIERTIMGTYTKKRFFAKHAKSSAALVSVGIHALLIVIALSFVAVTVINKEEQKFEAKPVSRPKMQLKKLQVPVNIKKKKVQKPKLRKRIVVMPKLNQQMPDIKMPEITGVKGGLGNAGGDGLGGAGDLGFTMPEMELFGVKSRGEKVFIILDSSNYMMVDQMGGIRAYEIIKSELIRILGELNSTVIFNVAVYSHGGFTAFPEMVPATPANVAKVDAWLKPLNAVKQDAGSTKYGTGTLAPGGTRIEGDFKVDPLKTSPGEWAQPTMLAMKEQADAIFVLSCRWGHLLYETGEVKNANWDEDDKREYEDNIKKARQKLVEENKRRAAKGEPPRVLVSTRSLVRAYFPNAKLPPDTKVRVSYTPDEMVEAFGNMRKQGKDEKGLNQRLGDKKKDQFSLNIIHFVSDDYDSGKDQKFTHVAKRTRGEYKQVKGLSAIQSYVSSSGDE
ncbi:hypothetical protein P4E94_17875 [Pontiellaceae bacterium B12219]|nr:hypothetical protein [Pontiellaceae bacterium B12219]